MSSSFKLIANDAILILHFKVIFGALLLKKTNVDEKKLQIIYYFANFSVYLFFKINYIHY